VYPFHGRIWWTNITEAGVWLCFPPETTDILSKENTFCRFKTNSYSLFESYYKTNLIVLLPLSMPKLKKEKNETSNSCCWIFTEATTLVASMETTPLLCSTEYYVDNIPFLHLFFFIYLIRLMLICFCFVLFWFFFVLFWVL
jgi:hypothetical protein